jgi:hypothetical protein
VYKFISLSFLSLSFFISSAFAGNIGGVGDGGGGGVIPVPATTQKSVEDFALHSKMMIIGYLQAREIKYYKDLKGHKVISSLDQKLFGQAKNIFKTMDMMKIDFKNSTECFDNNGNAVDGSVNDPASNSICISSFRLTPKLDENSVQYQVPALVIHEISHHLGTTEVEAQELQADYIKKNFRKEPRSYQNLALPQNEIWNAHNGVRWLSEDIVGQNINCDRVSYFLSAIHNLKTAESLGIWGGEVSWIGAKDYDFLIFAEVKANAMADLLCSWDKSLPADKAKTYLNRYLSGFVGPGPYLASDYVNPDGIEGWKGIGLAQVPIRKCSSADCVQDETGDLMAILMSFLVSVGRTGDYGYFERL